MRKLVSRFALSLLTVGMLVGTAGTASAVAVNLFHSPANDGTFSADPLTVGSNFTLNLWAVSPIDVYALNPMNLLATGSIGMGACTAATNALCGGSVGTTNRIVAWDEAINGLLAGTPVKIAEIAITVGAGVGTLNLTSGAGTDFYFTDITIDPNTILSAVPEPGTLMLLGIGLSGLVLQGRRREN